MNVPNFFTTLRIFSIPLLVFVLLSHFQGREYVGFGIFLFASLTDLLDGFWARRKKQITVFGQLLDPIADKLLITSALICLVEEGTVLAWMVVIIIGREIAVTGFRAIAASRGVNIPASILGKVKMVLETVTVAILILGRAALGWLYIFSQIGLWLILVIALFSAAEYYIKYGPRVLSKSS